MSKEEILNAIGDAGIVGMGGAGFPTKCKTYLQKSRIRLIISLQTVQSVSHILQQITEQMFGAWRGVSRRYEDNSATV